MTVNMALNVSPIRSLKDIPESVSFLKLFVETNMRLRRFKIMDISKKD